MANFSIQANIQVLPLEEISFTDTTQKAKGIHSSIDRSFSATSTAQLSTTSTNVAAYTLTIPANTDGVLSTLLSISVDAGIAVMFVKILSPVITQQVLIQLKAEDGAGAEYANIYLGSQQEFVFLNLALIAEDIITSNAYSTAVTLEILLGKVG